MEMLSEIPGDTPSGFRIWKLPGNGALITGVHAGAALDAIFNLKMHQTLIVFCITVCRTYIGGAMVGTG